METGLNRLSYDARTAADAKLAVRCRRPYSTMTIYCEVAAAAAADSEATAVHGVSENRSFSCTEVLSYSFIIPHKT